MAPRNIPPTDRLLARGLRFYVSAKAKPRGPWERLGEATCDDLDDAMGRSAPNASSEYGVFVQLPHGGGLLYWTSADASTFNTSALLQAHEGMIAPPAAHVK